MKKLASVARSGCFATSLANQRLNIYFALHLTKQYSSLAAAQAMSPDAVPTATVISSSTSQESDDLSQPALLSRISDLETKLRAANHHISSLIAQSQSLQPASAADPPLSRTKIKNKRLPKPFDISSYATRHIALKFSYIGTEYNGFEHTNNVNSAPAKPTIEEVLWKALRKARLIGPIISDGADQSYDVVWGERERAERYGVGHEGAGRGKRGRERLELVWDGMSYSKCGRTDKGVSAFGQVIGVTVRSSQPVKKKTEIQDAVEDEDLMTDTEQDVSLSNPVDGKQDFMTSWDPIRDELPYISILNSVLPPTIRVLAWCPDSSSTFNARFSCKERRYKYFFTNPAMCPTVGQPETEIANGIHSEMRQGWLNIEAMRLAAKKLEGLHDYRNLCKIDASKQMTSCERRITFADIEEFDSGMDAFMHDLEPNKGGLVVDDVAHDLAHTVLKPASGPKIYTFTVHGTAFLWHQVRCMVAILFLVGQGLELPEIVDQLLDIAKTPGKPHYEMADDTPLVLWDCVFPGDDPGEEGGMQWIYAGDEDTQTTLAKGAGKFGAGGLIDQLWSQWRHAKMQETLTAGLLSLALHQGNASPFEGGTWSSKKDLTHHSQRVFDGSDTPRLVGEYVRVMQRSKMEPLEVQNAKYAAGKQSRRDLKKANDSDTASK